MIFQQPWAWLGLLAIALPILAHLLARRPAPHVKFPHFRFLPPASATPVRRARIADAGLLALRCAVFAAAVAALAQPLWRPPAGDAAGSAAGAQAVTAAASTGAPDVATPATVAEAVRWLPGAAERAGAEAAWAAALATGAPAFGRSDRLVAIVLPHFEQRAELLAQARSINVPWMFDVIHAVTRDDIFVAAVERTGRWAASVLTVRRGPVDGTERLLIFTDTRANDVATAALASAVARATAGADIGARDKTVDAAETAATPSNDGDSDGRWLWLTALVLLLVEGRVRRSRDESASHEVRHAA